jgi:hypothetical protein
VPPLPKEPRLLKPITSRPMIARVTEAVTLTVYPKDRLDGTTRQPNSRSESCGGRGSRTVEPGSSGDRINEARADAVRDALILAAGVTPTMRISRPASKEAFAHA